MLYVDRFELDDIAPGALRKKTFKFNLCKDKEALKRQFNNYSKILSFDKTTNNEDTSEKNVALIGNDHDTF